MFFIGKKNPSCLLIHIIEFNHGPLYFALRKSFTTFLLNMINKTKRFIIIININIVTWEQLSQTLWKINDEEN